ncbi:MAG: 50S ribosomal protein L15 [Candidatus Pacebacteria bacterium]|nr:50S ribosomal protein L15 [Candidatus Paceibacterota bacterium]
MQLNELKRKTSNRKQKRVGRGRGSGKGKTSGRGTKGQKARAGHKMMPAIREQLKKLPKKRGYSFKSIKDKPTVLNVATLERYFTAGDTISPAVLVERGLLVKGHPVKILGDGELAKKLTISGCAVSASARTKIEKVGGSVVV